MFLALSGGADSAAVAVIVRIMCDRIIASISDEQVARDVRTLIGAEAEVPASGQGLSRLIFCTAYFGWSDINELLYHIF